jgi:hypothetical protein
MPSRIVTLVTGCDGLEMVCRANYPFARHRAAPSDMRGFSATPGSDWRGLSTFAPALFVEDGVRSIRQSVQNGQFLFRLAQMRRGGNLPPVSILSRREFGLRVLRK